MRSHTDKLCLAAILLLSGCTSQNVPLPDEMTTTTLAVSETAPEEVVEQSLDGLVIEDGKLMPILSISDMRDEAYTNEGSDILRFCVYVETDHDTDGDGMNDLVKVFMQVPHAASKGKFKAGTIYDPTPYNAGTVEELYDSAEPMYNEKEFDYDKLYASGGTRTPDKEISTLELSKAADPNDWNYSVPYSGETGYIYGNMYDYYLARGYAVAQCSGIGTYGSEGFELCGMDLERDSHKAVVEWLAGKRTAFADKQGKYAVPADFSNGRVAMTGCSYGGTLPYEVATTGVEGLVTIIPFAGIANWYDYTNSQGVSTRFDTHYTDDLASYNAGATFEDDGWMVPGDEYGSYLWQVAQDEEASNGNYSDMWSRFDYSDKYEDIKCSALIVHGLNDFNVLTRQADLMMQAFDKAGANAKLVLHQDGHNFLNDIEVNGELWQDTMNKWLAHYLYGVDNGIQDMAKVTVQSNVDGSFKTYDKWRDFDYNEYEVRSSSAYAVSTLDTTNLAETAYQYLTAQGSDIGGIDYQQTYYIDLEEPLGVQYEVDIPEGTTIYGVPEIHVQMATNTLDKDGMMVTATLTDVTEDESRFKAFMGKQRINSCVPVSTIGTAEAGGGLPDVEIKQFVQSNTYSKVITYGWTDLCNPGKGYDAKEYTDVAELENEKYYDYTFYMQPTVYTVEKGHKLVLTLSAWDPYRAFLDEDYELDPEHYTEYTDHKYTFFVDNYSVTANIPTV
ncbi:MAG: hypothetical protein IJ080_07650 [Oscillospiraceae bacterium]|nr:hypothetical protein [Oscillospiraceae bacterium]